MNTISLKRIKLLLLADWYELKEYLLWIVVGALGIVLLLFFSSQFALNAIDLVAILSFMFVITFLLSMNYVTYRSNSTKGLGLLTPATPFEKLVAQVIVFVFLFVLCLALYFIATGGYSLLSSGTVNPLIFSSVGSFYYRPFMDFWLLILIFFAVFWLCMMTFKKYAIFKAIAFVAGIIWFFVESGSSDFSVYAAESHASFYETDISKHCIENIYPGIYNLLALPYQYFLLVVILLTVFYAGYLKLKEKEQR